jgi:hypothetical protein
MSLDVTTMFRGVALLRTSRVAAQPESRNGLGHGRRCQLLSRGAACSPPVSRRHDDIRGQGLDAVANFARSSLARVTQGLGHGRRCRLLSRGAACSPPVSRRHDDVRGQGRDAVTHFLLSSSARVAQGLGHGRRCRLPSRDAGFSPPVSRRHDDIRGQGRDAVTHFLRSSSARVAQWTRAWTSLPASQPRRGLLASCISTSRRCSRPGAWRRYALLA